MRLILPISFLLISLVLFLAVINPIYGDVKTLKNEVSTYNVALDNSTDLQKTRDALIDVYKSVTKDNKERLEHILPNTVGNIELILEIEKIANLHGMPIKNIKFETKNLVAKEAQPDLPDDIIAAENDPTANLPYGIFPMEFVIEGRYDTFISFLQDLEKNLRLVDIKGIAFNVPEPTKNASGEVTNSNIYSFTLKVETYWLK